jgi:Homing endonuclease associated repeat
MRFTLELHHRNTPDDDLLSDLKRVAKEIGKSSLHISNEELFDNLVRVWTQLGRQPKYQDLTSETSKYSAGTYEYRFGSWRKGLEAFVHWADEGEVVDVGVSLVQRTARHRTSRHINYRLRFLVMRRDHFKCRITGRSPATDPNVVLRGGSYHFVGQGRRDRNGEPTNPREGN